MSLDLSNPAGLIGALGDVYLEDCSDENGPYFGLGCSGCGDLTSDRWPITEDEDAPSVATILQATLAHLAGCPGPEAIVGVAEADHAHGFPGTGVGS